MTLIHPVPQGKQTDGYGPRGFVAGLGDLGFHTGQDWAAPAGTPILAAQSGTVSRKWWDAFANGAGAGGNMVAIRSDNGWETRYAHLLFPSHLAVGARVSAGEQIGQVGKSGAATGNHLHFELFINGRHVNPLPYIATSNTQQSRSKRNSQMLMINLPQAASDGKGLKYAVFSSNFWLEFEGDAAAAQFMAQIQPGVQSLQVSKSFWDYCKNAAKSGITVNLQGSGTAMSTTELAKAVNDEIAKRMAS